MVKYNQKSLLPKNHNLLKLIMNLKSLFKGANLKKIFNNLICSAFL